MGSWFDLPVLKKHESHPFHAPEVMSMASGAHNFTFEVTERSVTNVFGVLPLMYWVCYCGFESAQLRFRCAMCTITTAPERT